MPLAPSRLAPYETDDTGEPSPSPRPPSEIAEPPPPSPASAAGDSRFLRGTLTHALLEHLPLLDPKTWPKAAKSFVAERGAALSARHRASIVSETLAILNDATFAPLFGAESRAEVPIAAVIPRPHGNGPALRLTGQIDRLAEVGDAVLIVDYKTNRSAPRELADVAPVYLYQLAAYRLAVAEIFKGKTVRAALLWTDGPWIMEIPSATLDSYATRLWDLDPASLDG
jgi:ATP-dependent helicase/nuclease subunit A